MRKQFNNIGKIGIVNDTDPYNLPEEAWSEGQNVRFVENRIEKINGHATALGTPAINPYWLLPVTTTANYFWIYPGLTQVYVSDGTTQTNITRQTAGSDVLYNATADDGWNGGVISGIPIINNGIDGPQVWNPVAITQRLTSLPYDATNTWDDVSYTAKVFRTFKQFVLALDVNKNGARDPHMMMWSTTALSNALPTTWDKTDDTAFAGEADFSDSKGYLVDCLPLRDSNIVYKEDAVWGMDLINTNEVFNFYPMFREVGLLTSRCVKEVEGRHLCLTTGDVIIHDGQNIDSIVDKKMRRFIFSNMDTNNYRRSFIAPFYQKNEMWICFPGNGAEFPNKAVVWNYRDNTTSIRELPEARHIGYGNISTGSQDLYWDDFTSTTWDGGLNPDDGIIYPGGDFLWGERTYTPTQIANVIAAGANLYKTDQTTQFNGQSFTAYVQREGLDFGDPHLIKQIKRIYPKMESTGPVQISVGVQMKKTDPINWTNYTFDPSTDEKLDVRKTGRFISFKFQSTTAISWRLNSFEMDVEPRGFN